MEIDIDVPITVPPLRFFKAEGEDREDITDASYQGFSDYTQTRVVFRVDDGEYVIVDERRSETKLTVREGKVTGLAETKRTWLAPKEPIEEKEEPSIAQIEPIEEVPIEEESTKNIVGSIDLKEGGNY